MQQHKLKKDCSKYLLQYPPINGSFIMPVLYSAQKKIVIVLQKWNVLHCHWIIYATLPFIISILLSSRAIMAIPSFSSFSEQPDSVYIRNS